MYQNFIIPYLHEAQHVSGDTPSIFSSLKPQWQLDVVRHSVPDNARQLHVQQPSTHEKPDVAIAVLGC
jgi:hypothetical protein